MRSNRYFAGGIVAIFAMFVLILDTKTALIGAQTGLDMCIRAVIPSLFPFIVLSKFINNYMFGKEIKFMKPLRKLCKIPIGTESLLLVSFLSGYPVGATLITQAYKAGALSRDTAKRMLGFCNNAGPAFLFGMLSPMFDNARIPWILWIVHIVSALIVGALLPDRQKNGCRIYNSNPISLPKALEDAIKTIATICGWVILFRILIEFSNRWFLWLFQMPVKVLYSGLLELSNGCIMLRELPSAGFRFLIASIILSFGGLCVGMQTVSVTKTLGTGYYFPGKVLQTLITILLCSLVEPFLFSPQEAFPISIPYLIFIVSVLLILIYLIHRKKL